MDYFEKYKEAKLCLYCMVGQFLDYYVDIEELPKYGINYSKEKLEDTYNTCGDSFNLCFHDFKDEGLIAWDYLNIEKPFITHEEIWDRSSKIKDEVKDDNIDYYQMYLKFSILLIDMVINHYKTIMSIEDVRRIIMDYDEVEDRWENDIYACYHMFENAGESVWSLFEIDFAIVGQSVFYKKRKEFVEKLLEIDDSKVKKIG